MIYFNISFTHKNTDLNTREKLFFSNDLQKDIFLQDILSHDYIQESVLLSTCNRVEIICSVSNIKLSQNIILEKLSQYSKIDFDDLFQRADIFDSNYAIHHLFCVASSIDSLVIGETQIVGQLRDAFDYSLKKGFCTLRLSRAFKYAFKCAAKVRTTTSLGSGSVSIASTAVAKAKDIFHNKRNKRALVIGSGNMSSLAIKHLLNSNFEVILTSRDYNKARLLSSTFEREIIVEPYDKMQKLLNSIEVLITATSAPYAIIKDYMVEDCSFNRYWFDLAVPRDIDNIIINKLKIYYVDDLNSIININKELRSKEVKKAYLIVSNMTKEFFSWLRTLEVEPIVKQLNLNAHNIIDNKIDNAIKKGFILDKDKNNIKKLCESVIAEFLHRPSNNLRNNSKLEEGDIVLESIQDIFELDKC